MYIRFFIENVILYTAYNKACDVVNSGLINYFNVVWEDSGKEPGTDEYDAEYFKMFRNVMQPMVDDMLKGVLNISVKLKDTVFEIRDGKGVWLYEIA